MLMRKLVPHFAPSWDDNCITNILYKSDDQNVYKSTDNDF